MNFKLRYVLAVFPPRCKLSNRAKGDVNANVDYLSQAPPCDVDSSMLVNVASYELYQLRACITLVASHLIDNFQFKRTLLLNGSEIISGSPSRHSET